MMYEINFSNSNNTWYFPTTFSGNEIDMLNFVDEYLHNKENKMYGVFIYLDDELLYGGGMGRGKKIKKLIKSLK